MIYISSKKAAGASGLRKIWVGRKEPKRQNSQKIAENPGRGRENRRSGGQIRRSAAGCDVMGAWNREFGASRVSEERFRVLFRRFRVLRGVVFDAFPMLFHASRPTRAKKMQPSKSMEKPRVFYGFFAFRLLRARFENP